MTSRWWLGLPVLLVASSAHAQTATLVWSSGFEQGFPGEWLDYDSGAWTASGVPNGGANEAWTIVDAAGAPSIVDGAHVYKGWPVAAQAESHRAYPGFHSDIPSPLINSFWVYQELDYDQLTAPEWVHFATWGNNVDWEVHTMSVRDRRLEMAHLSWSWIGPTPQPDFPLDRWVHFTAYIDYTDNGYIRVWQDGVPVLEGNYTARSGNNLMRSHWGWYSSGSIDQGVQYNDEIRVCTLSARLTDLTTEPECGPTVTPQDGGPTPGDPGIPGDPGAPGDGATTGDPGMPGDPVAGDDASSTGDIDSADPASGVIGCSCNGGSPLALIAIVLVVRRRTASRPSC